MKKNLVSLEDWKKTEIMDILKLTKKVKKKPWKCADKLTGKTLLLMFDTPSLRTKISSATAITQLGGVAIDYALGGSPWSIGKETIEDSAEVISRYCNGILARLYDHQNIEDLAKYSKIPVINGMTNYVHPLQIIGDLFTIKERFKVFSGKKLAYFGDANNNVTHSLLFGCSLMGIDIAIVCPKDKEFMPLLDVVRKAKEFARGSEVEIIHDPKKVKDVNVIYTDSWMSYRIPKKEKMRRMKILKAYQVNKEVMKRSPHAIFMHCLPALRDQEVSAGVFDGSQSVVFDQAENRLHTLKTLLLRLMK